MNLQRGCMYCKNLKHDFLLTEFECVIKKNLRLINAGACMVAERNGRQEIVSDCPDFVSKHDACKKNDTSKSL